MKRERNKPVYVISVAAELVEMPARTENNIRLYSDEDIERLRQIQRLTGVGLNLAGVEMVLNLLARMDIMRRELQNEMERRQEEMEQEINRLRQSAAGTRR
jgi:MerR family transcriptional regulator/heat shock protein HspR